MMHKQMVHRKILLLCWRTLAFVDVRLAGSVPSISTQWRATRYV